MTRSVQLRDLNRKVFRWSLAAAVAVHVAVFVLTPDFQTEPLPGSEQQGQPANPESWTPTLVDLIFGPPAIEAEDGTVWTEPNDRVLQVDRGLHLPMNCSTLALEGRTPLHGDVQLRVNASGRVDVVDMTETTGDPCGDTVLQRVAGDLWYRWLPSDRFPAPVELVQPITLAEIRE